jgi:hypothetical protein
MIVTPVAVKYKKNGTKALQGYITFGKNLSEKLGWKEKIMTCIFLERDEVLDEKSAILVAAEVQELIDLEEEVEKMKQVMMNETMGRNK